MEDIGTLVWFIMIVIWIISSMVQKARQFSNDRPGQSPPASKPAPPRGERREARPARQEPVVDPMEEIRKAMLRSLGVEPVPEGPPPVPQPAQRPIERKAAPRHTEGQSLVEHLSQAAAHQPTPSEHRPTASEHRPTASEHRPTDSEHRLTPSEHQMGELQIDRSARKQSVAPRTRRRSRHPLAVALRSPRRLADAIVAREVLDPPLALRSDAGRSAGS